MSPSFLRITLRFVPCRPKGGFDTRGARRVFWHAHVAPKNAQDFSRLRTRNDAQLLTVGTFSVRFASIWISERNEENSDEKAILPSALARAGAFACGLRREEERPRRAAGADRDERAGREHYGDGRQLRLGLRPWKRPALRRGRLRHASAGRNAPRQHARARDARCAVGVIPLHRDARLRQLCAAVRLPALLERAVLGRHGGEAREAVCRAAG